MALRSVTVRVGERSVLSEVSLAVAPGELVALVGPNGAGKTTALRVLAGDTVAHQGHAELDGAPIRELGALELARRRAVLPQSSTIEFAFTAGDVVRMGRAPHAGTPAERLDDELVVDAMQRTDCSHLCEREYRSLSGGEQARVSLARVLAQACPYVLLDEPTAALDIRHQEGVMALAAGLARDGCGVLAVVHDLNLAAAYADRVALLTGGRLLCAGPPEAVLTDELLSAAYGCAITVRTHPTRGCPLVLAASPVAPAEARTDARSGS